MKRFNFQSWSVALFLFAALAVWMPTKVSAANSFLEDMNNYSVMPKGNGVVHFKIPVWSYGAINNYRAGSPTMLWYSNQYIR